MASDPWEKVVKVYDLKHGKAFRKGRTILDSKIIGLKAAQQFMPEHISDEALKKLKRELLDELFHIFMVRYSPQAANGVQAFEDSVALLLAPKPRYTVSGHHVSLDADTCITFPTPELATEYAAFKNAQEAKQCTTT